MATERSVAFVVPLFCSARISLYTVCAEKGIIMSKNIKVTMTAIFSMCILLVAAAGVKADSNLQQKTVHILTKQEKEQKQELQQIKKELTKRGKNL